MTRPLRAVGPNEPAAKPRSRRRTTITQAAEGGTVREQLVALRTRLAKALDDVNCSTRDLASLSKRLMEITKEIAAIDVQATEEAGGAATTPDEAWTAI